MSAIDPRASSNALSMAQAHAASRACSVRARIVRSLKFGAASARTPG
jgi:hypothetical protein